MENESLDNSSQATENIDGQKSFFRFVVLFIVISLTIMLFRFYGNNAVLALNTNSAITGKAVLGSSYTGMFKLQR